MVIGNSAFVLNDNTKTRAKDAEDYHDCGRMKQNNKKTNFKRDAIFFVINFIRNIFP